MAEERSIQPSERKTAAFDFASPLAISGANLVSGELFCSDSTAPPVPATLQDPAAEGDDEITLDVNPRVGARLTMNESSDNAEVVKVTAVSGSSAPFTATIVPVLGFDHADNEPVSIERGTSAAMLASPTPTIVGTRAVYIIQRPVHAHTYRTSVRVLLDNGDYDEHEVFWVCQDL